MLLTWTFYSSLILLAGAEMTQMHAARRGSRATPSEHATAVELPVASAEDPPRTRPMPDDDSRTSKARP